LKGLGLWGSGTVSPLITFLLALSHLASNVI
jgi:hypothetical protein